MPDQNYHAPIHNVFNFDISGDLVGFLPSSIKPTLRAILAPTLVDRRPQLQAIVGRIDKLVDSGAGGKLLVVVPGIRPDLHQSLVLRCGLAHFGEHYDQQNGWAYLGRVPWPRGARAVLPILRALGEALALPRSARDHAAIEKELASYQKSICFSHYLDAAWWNDQEQRLVLDWVDYVCKTWPTPKAGRLLVAFLCLDYGAVGNDPFADLVAKLRRRKHTVLVTDRLDLICAADVDDWVSEVGRYLKLPFIEAELFGVSDELFPPAQQPLRFAEVYKRLYQRLAPLFTPGPIFTRRD